MTHECTCTSCGKKFDQNSELQHLRSALATSSGAVCYGCALAEITKGRAPEEGDFNTARIVSGEMTDKEARWLQEDLRAVEEGRSIREPYYDEAEEDYVDPAWCYQCNRDIAFCKCICHECGEDIDNCQCE